MRLIDADELKKKLLVDAGLEGLNWLKADKAVNEQPTIDAVPVVRCHDCIMHNNCTTEDAFKLCGIEDPFCCAGKRKDGE